MVKRVSTRAKKSAKARPESPVSEEDYVSGSNDLEDASLHSDALDDWSDDAASKASPQKKRRRGLSSTRTPKSKSKPASGGNGKSKQGASGKTSSPAKKKRKVEDAEDERDDDDDDIELKDGQQVVGKVVEAPTTGWGELCYRAHVCDSRVV